MKNNIKFDLSGETRKAYEKYFSPLDESDKNKLMAYFYIILTLIALVFFGVFAISPTLNTISNLNKQYSDDKAVKDALETKLNNLRSLDAQYDTMQTNLDQIYSAIPKKTDIPKLTRQLETLATSDNVQVTRLAFNTVEIYPNSNSNSIYSFLFTINISGNTDDVNKFIGDIINFDRIIGIERISTGTDQEKKYTASITGRAFFAPN